jgi:hypothetical protein
MLPLLQTSRDSREFYRTPLRVRATSNALQNAGQIDTGKITNPSSKENIEMRGTKAFFAVVVLTAIVGLACAAHAQVQFVGVGSSAMFNTISAAAFTDLCSSRAGSDCRHWSAKGKNSADNQNWAQGVDSRNSAIPVEAGSFFVAWDNNSTPIKIWSYLNVDTIVGERLFFAVPRATQQIDSGALSAAGQNLVPAPIMLNRQTSADQPDETAGIPHPGDFHHNWYRTGLRQSRERHLFPAA